jgi:DNA-binding NarL/FixJ family response regulator
MTLIRCMMHDWLWIAITVALDVAVAAGYILIAWHWQINQRLLPRGSAPRRALGNMRNILCDLRAAGSDVKVVVTTGMADPERMQSLVSLHPHAILRKPIDFSGLLRTIL